MNNEIKKVHGLNYKKLRNINSLLKIKPNIITLRAGSPSLVHPGRSTCTLALIPEEQKNKDGPRTCRGGGDIGHCK